MGGKITFKTYLSLKIVGEVIHDMTCEENFHYGYNGYRSSIRIHNFTCTVSADQFPRII